MCHLPINKGFINSRSKKSLEDKMIQHFGSLKGNHRAVEAIVAFVAAFCQQQLAP